MDAVDFSCFGKMPKNIIFKIIAQFSQKCVASFFYPLYVMSKHLLLLQT